MTLISMQDITLRENHWKTDEKAEIEKVYLVVLKKSGMLIQERDGDAKVLRETRVESFKELFDMITKVKNNLIK